VQTMLEHSPCTVYKEDYILALDVRSQWYPVLLVRKRRFYTSREEEELFTI
jgi:hypothetical protein